MLILCIGPDTFRAQKHAELLERAFRDKYDAAGTSVERLSAGKTAVKEIESRAGALSLFDPKRFLRTRNLLGEIGKKEIPSLSSALAKNTDGVIVVSIEEEVPKADLLKQVEERVKIIKYAFPQQTGAAFQKWLLEEAKTAGVSDEAVRQIAQRFDGDSWRAWNELMKIAAGGGLSDKESEVASVFQLIEGILKNENNKFQFLSSNDSSKELAAILPSQAITAMRIKDGYTDGVHPFQKQKLSRLALNEVEYTVASSLLSHLLTRRGYTDDVESALLIR